MAEATLQDKFNFNVAEGAARKEEGINLAQTRRGVILAAAKRIAVQVAKEHGEVTSDEVFLGLREEGFDPLELGSASGSVFRGKEFIFSGRWKKSWRVSNHASDLRVWVLRKDDYLQKQESGGERA